MDDNQQNFQEIYTAFQPKILRYMIHLVGESEAEDLTQEVFVKAHRALEKFRGEAKISTWLYRIATNTAMDKLRSPSFQKRVEFRLTEDSSEDNLTGSNDTSILGKEEYPPVEKQLISEEMNDCIRGYVEKLPETFRVALVMSEYEGLKNNQIAEVLGVSLDTIKIRLHRARVILKKELETNCEIHWIEEIPCSVMIPIK